MTALQLILSAFLFCFVSIPIFTKKHFLQEDDNNVISILLGIILLFFIWVPLSIDYYIPVYGFAALFLFDFLGVLTIPIIACWIAVNAYFAGAGNALLLGSCFVFYTWKAYCVLKQILRLQRAKQVISRKTPRHEVLFEGTLHAISPAKALLPDISCALWKIQIGETIKQSEEIVEIVGDFDSVLFEPKDTTLDWQDIKQKNLSEEETQQMIKKFGFPDNDAVNPEENPISGTIFWIEEGKRVCILGLPVWESSPYGIKTYRDTRMLPVFRNRNQNSERSKECKNFEKTPYFADRPTKRLRKEFIYELFSLLRWSLLFLATAVLQVIIPQ